MRGGAPLDPTAAPDPGRIDRERVDALFSGEPPAPALEGLPRIRRLQLVLLVAIPLDLLGIPCWTGVPGAILTLYAWLIADGQKAAIDAGQYPHEQAAALLRLRQISAWALGLCVVSLMLQAWLLSSAGYRQIYDAIWGRILGGLLGF